MRLRMKKGKHERIHHAKTRYLNKLFIVLLSVVVLALCMAYNIIGPMFAFFSDTVSSALSGLTGSISLNLYDLKLQDTNASTYQTDPNNALVQVNNFTLGNVNEFDFTLSNDGKNAIKVTSMLKIAWDDSNTDLPEDGIVYLYPAAMTDDEIKSDIADNNAGLALLNENSNDQVNLTMNDGTNRKGVEYDLDTIYLDSSLAGGQTTPLSGSSTSKTYDFKVAMAASSSQVSGISIYKNENLKIDIEAQATTVTPSIWKYTKKATVELDNFNFAETAKDFNYTGNYEEYIVPVTGQYRLEVWGAQGGNASLTTGGKGGYSTGIVTLEQGTVLYVYVGGQATDSLGGFNGGGTGSSTITANAPGGGGASDIRIATNSLYARAVVAGGGRWR